VKPFSGDSSVSVHGQTIYFLTLIVETVNSIDAGCLVVSSQEEEVLRVQYLVSKQEADSFK